MEHRPNHSAFWYRHLPAAVAENITNPQQLTPMAQARRLRKRRYRDHCSVSGPETSVFTFWMRRKEVGSAQYTLSSPAMVCR
jgi:hypothetical protein